MNLVQNIIKLGKVVFFKEVENSFKKVNANCEEVQIEHNNKKVNKHIYMIPI